MMVSSPITLNNGSVAVATARNDHIDSKATKRNLCINTNADIPQCIPKRLLNGTLPSRGAIFWYLNVAVKRFSQNLGDRFHIGAFLLNAGFEAKGRSRPGITVWFGNVDIVSKRPLNVKQSDERRWRIGNKFT
jgi:hypothetical protein